MKTIERLKEFIDYKDISLNSFDTIIEAGTGYIGKQIKRSGSIGSDVIEKIVCAFPDLNPLWLITGQGNMIIEVLKYADTPQHDNTFNEQLSYNTANTPVAKTGGKVSKTAPPTAPPTDKKGVNTRTLVPQFITVDTKGNDNIVYVPIKAAAGYLNGYEDHTYIESLPSFNLPGLDKKSYRAFEISGDSMYPTLENKEMVIGEWVEKLDYIREDRVHIIVTKNEGVIVKRLLNRIEKYGYIIAKSDNPNDRNLYPNIEIHPDDILEVWYAVWHGGFNFKAPGDLWKRQNNLEADLTEIMRRLNKAGL